MEQRSTSHASTQLALRTFWDRLGLSTEERSRAEFSSRRYFPVLEFLRSDPPRAGQRVLDLGGGIGSLSVALHARFGGAYHLADFAVPSVERQEVLRASGVERCFSVRLDRPGPLADLPRGYHWILFAEVLEHLLTNPIVLFRELADHLGPGGHLLLTTPNQARARNRVRLALGRSIKEKDQFPVDGSPTLGHVMEYTLEELASLLGSVGLSVERARVIQNLPTARTTRSQRTMVRLLNTAPADAMRLGDDILMVARKASGSAPASGEVSPAPECGP